MRVVLFLMLMILGFSSFSQKLDSVQKVEFLDRIHQLELEYDFKEIIDSCDKHLFEEECGWFRKELTELKIKCKYELLKSKLEEDIGDHKYDDLFEYFLYEIDSIILNEKTECGEDTLIYNRMKYEFYGAFDLVLPELNSGINSFYISEDFLAISPQYYYGNNQWVGAELFFGIYERKEKMKYIEGDPMASFSFISLGFRKNISNRKGWGVNFSLFSGSYKWINVRPINFTYLSDGNKDSWGYSPEIGLQFWYLHLNAGYNFAFEKSMRSYEKLYFTAKFDIPFYRF